MSRPRRGGKRPPQSAAPRNPLSDSDQRAIDGERLKSEGNQLFVQDDFKEAVNRYKEAIQVHGPHAIYSSNLAAAYLKLKRYDLAEEAATAALEQDPWMIQALHQRGIARKETCQFSAAQMDFARILSKDPDSVSANAELAVIHTLLAYGKPTPETPAPSAEGAVVLQLSLAHEDFLDQILAHTLAALRARTTLHVARNATQALEFLASSDLCSVFVTDPGISESKHGKVLAKLVAFAKAGGSVVIGGVFSSFIAPPKLAAFFRDAWGLPWKMGAYHRALFSLNPAHETVKGNPSLLPSYSMKAAHLRNIGAGVAIYTSPYSPAEAPVCQGRIGDGRVGYVGDVNGEQGSTNAVLAMLGVLDILESSSNEGLARFILHIVLGETYDEADSDLLDALDPVTTLSTARSAADAIPLLSSPALGGVLITDAGIVEQRNAQLLSKLVAYTKAGGTVVIGAPFSFFMSAPETDAFFGDGWGLPWKRTAYHRATFALNRNAALAASSPALPAAYFMKGVHLSGIPAAAALYLEPGTQTTELEAPVVFAEVGEGRLGYIGDVTSSDASTAVVLAMFGLEPKST